MQIDFLNHASVIISHKETRLLIDPWFWGTCFDGGWGLRFDNPEAIHKAGNCTHLWVSHPHQDHLHKPTLQKILELNPGIQFIGNNSYNFQLDKTAQSLGFKNVTPLYERKTIKLSGDFSI
ncbi:MAG: MBL fold metallo-hydrolase, partial [Chitinophagaceae bacterium]|nr:MBL fold metallo-hydrolase [Chitinophagaceae bacterium]